MPRTITAAVRRTILRARQPAHAAVVVAEVAAAVVVVAAQTRDLHRADRHAEALEAEEDVDSFRSCAAVRGTISNPLSASRLDTTTTETRCESVM